MAGQECSYTAMKKGVEIQEVLKMMKVQKEQNQEEFMIHRNLMKKHGHQRWQGIRARQRRKTELNTN